MQSTKDESSWEGRIGGGFVRLHHSINQKKRFFKQNGVEDESNIQDWPTSLSFSATKDGYSLPLANQHFNNRVGYNMQFLRHDANQISYKKWGDQEEWTDGIGDSNNVHHSMQDDVRSSYVSSFWMEKLLVVLLVASATVCFLTNLLVLVILTKRRKRRSISKSIKSGAQKQEMNNGNTRWNPVNTFRYQIVTSQCFAGIVASAVVIYPLKILSLVLSRSDIAFHRETMKNVQIDKVSTTVLDTKETSYFGFLTSQSICIFMCSSPLVGFIFLSLLHNLMLSFEQFLKKISRSHYMVLVSSQGYTRLMVGSLWVVAFCFTLLPTILDPNMTNKWSKNMSKSSQYYKHHVLQRLKNEERQKFHEFNSPKQSICYLKSYWSFEYWLLISVGSAVISFAFCVLWIITSASNRHKKDCTTKKCVKEKSILEKTDLKHHLHYRNDESSRMLKPEFKPQSNASFRPENDRKFIESRNVYGIQHRQKLEQQFSTESASTECSKTLPIHRMKKWSSWPVMAYPGLDQVSHSVKRSERCKKPRHLQLVRLANSSRSEMYDFDDDTRPIISTNKSKTSTMIVKTIPPTPLDVSTLLSCKINFTVVLLLLIPSIIYSIPNQFVIAHSNYLQDILYQPSGRISQISHHDIITMAWTHFLVAIAGAFTPVLHLLCDDWISTLGLEALRSFQFSPRSYCHNGKMAFLYSFFKRHVNRDPNRTQTTEEVNETAVPIKEPHHTSTFHPTIRQQPSLPKTKDFSVSVTDTLSNVKEADNHLKPHACENDDISASIAKTSSVAKNNFYPIREIEESIGTKNSSIAKTSTYDDLIELKDDLHYL